MQDNPLKQYFRRPTLYFKLPSDGRYYEPGVVEIPENGELAVYAMTAADEITIRTPDAALNGSAITALFKSCVPGILQPWKINTIDIEAVLLAIRAANNNGSMQMLSTCPNCGTDKKHDIVLQKVIEDTKKCDYDTMLTVGDLSIKFRPLTFAETNKNDIRQLEIQRIIAPLTDSFTDVEKQELMTDALKQMNELILDIISSTIEYIQTPETQVYEVEFIREFLSSTDKQTTELIKNYSVSLREQGELAPVKLQCSSCKHEYEQKIIMGIDDLVN
jgi:hypothetical protein